jgi:tetratricopeptide (TPR) repeat protein
LLCCVCLPSIRDGHYSHGISCLSKSIELDSSISSFYSNRGDCFLALGETDQALSDYHVARDIDPHAKVANKVAKIHAKRGKELFNVSRSVQ